MHEELVEAETRLGISLLAIASAAERTAARRSDARAAIADHLAGQDRADEPLIVAFGSMARQEMAARSDFDYLVVLNGVERDPARIVRYRVAADAARDAVGAKAPGTTGLFGVAVSGPELVNTIGLEGDTNLHLTRRVLLLEESVPLNSDEAWTTLVEAVCARYLHEHRQQGPKVPRFLLNDVVRYWRTIAVDYQAKRWQELTGDKWGLRFVKLITIRKLTFAAMTSSLFMPVILDVQATPQWLRDQVSMPALARLAQLTAYLGDHTADALARLLVAADRIVGLLNDPDFLDAVTPVADRHAQPIGSRMHEAVAISEDIQSALEDVFFSDEPLPHNAETTIGRITRRYLSF